MKIAPAPVGAFFFEQNQSKRSMDMSKSWPRLHWPVGLLSFTLLSETHYNDLNVGKAWLGSSAVSPQCFADKSAGQLSCDMSPA
jgi:hypothetical protein